MSLYWYQFQSKIVSPICRNRDIHSKTTTQQLDWNVCKSIEVDRYTVTDPDRDRNKYFGDYYKLRSNCYN